MKNAVICLIILLIITTLLVANAIILSKCSDKLLKSVEAMTDTPGENIRAAKSLLDYWQRLEPYVSISVVHSETESVSRAAIQIYEYARSGNHSEFVTAKSLFREAVEHIKFSGKLSLETIL